MKPKTKPKAKAKTTKAKPQMVAIKTRQTKKNAWMPDQVTIDLDGPTSGSMLMICGWTLGDARRWPPKRLQVNLARIQSDWAEDYGKGWKVEIQ